jgi:hypothetical protein
MQRPEKFTRAPAESELKAGSHPTNTFGATAGALYRPFAIGDRDLSPLCVRSMDCEVVFARGATADPIPAAGAISSTASMIAAPADV